MVPVSLKRFTIKALCYELTDARIPFDSEKAIEISYEGRLCGQFRPDMIVDGKIILELKALAGLNGEHVAQLISYLKATGLDLGILINFGSKSLETKRIVY